MSTTALSIDLMLPAFDDMRATFGLEPDSTDVARVVTAFFLGLAIGQIFYGPFADRFGRKPVLYASFGIYAIAAACSALAPTLELVFVSRFVWGMGAAGARVVAVAIVRDTYEGDEMARAMSFIMGIFILVPILAPSLGALIILVGPWQWVFWACAIVVVLVAIWARRMPETLDEADRLELRWTAVLAALRRVATTRETAGYTLAMMLLFGGFTSYLASSELIISEIFDRDSQFPVIFGAVAAVIGAAAFINASLVRRFGVHALLPVALGLYVVGTATLLVVAVSSNGRPGFWLFFVVLAATLSFHIVLIPGFNALAMAPLGDIAATASAAIGAVSSAGGALIGAVIDRNIHGSVTPLALGMFVLGCLASVALVLTRTAGRSVAPATA